MTDLPIAVHLGAGNIGRGFLGQVYFESGYRTVFVDVNARLVGALCNRGAYELEIAGESLERVTIGNVTAIHATDEDAVADAIAHARIASTAVGAAILPRLAPVIAKGLRRRLDPPLNILVCENLIDATTVLREAILSADRSLIDRFAAVDTTIGRMVTTIPTDDDIPLIRAEAYCRLPVNHAAVFGPLPALKHVELCGNFQAEIEKKLYIHNAAHAATAYLGAMRGHTYIWEAIEDPSVQQVVDGAMAEVIRALSRRHSIAIASLDALWTDLRARFANRLLGDTIERVARDPVRKLGRNERLVGAAAICVEEGVDPEHLIGAIGAAVRYAAREGLDAAANAKLANWVGEIRRRCGSGGVAGRILERLDALGR